MTTRRRKWHSPEQIVRKLRDATKTWPWWSSCQLNRSSAAAQR